MKSLVKKIISATLDEREKIYIHALPNKDLVIGRRGLINHEQTEGILLSISAASATDLVLEETLLYVKLRFSGKWEDVFVPYDSIRMILDDLKEPTIVFNFIPVENIPNNPKPVSDNKKQTTAKVIRPNFNKKD